MLKKKFKIMLSKRQKKMDNRKTKKLPKRKRRDLKLKNLIKNRLLKKNNVLYTDRFFIIIK